MATRDEIIEAISSASSPKEGAARALARVFSNKVDHRAEKIRLTVADGEIVLAALLRVVE
jgi:hypothetical protein